MDVHELNDGKILRGLSVAEKQPGVWTLTFKNDEWGEVSVETSEKPQGAALAACCDEIRRKVGARKASEEAKKRSKEAALRAANTPENPAPERAGGSGDPATESVQTFEEELSQRYSEREARELKLLADIAAAELELRKARKEKAAIKAAIEAMQEEVVSSA
jgi:hypothetical protein